MALELFNKVDSGIEEGDSGRGSVNHRPIHDQLPVVASVSGSRTS